MRIMRLVDEYKALQAESDALETEVTAVEHEARQDLASSASRFSRTTRDVLDDKLSFSATLMRAGEVYAAKRLLAEVAEDVTTSEAALVEQVNEVRLAQAVRRQRLTRARLLKGLIASMLGASFMVMSVMGFAVASMFDEDRRVAAQPARGGDLARSGIARTDMQVLTVAGVRLKLTQQELKLLRELTTGPIDKARLQDFLLSVVVDPSLVGRITAALTHLPEDVETEVTGLVVESAHDAEAEASSSAPEAEERDASGTNNDEQPHGEDKHPSGGGSQGSSSDGGPASGLPEPYDVLDGDSDPLS